MNRRKFMGFLGLAVAAPAIVRAESLMKLYVPPKIVIWGDGVHDDTEALQAFFDGGRIVDPYGREIGDFLAGMHLKVSKTIHIKQDKKRMFMHNHVISSHSTDPILNVHGEASSMCRNIHSSIFALNP